MSTPDSDPHLARYSRQMRFPGIGVAGQRQLGAATVLILGCGALGSFAANLLARAGIGHLRIVDRDFVDLSNLQRQILFDEDDVAQCLPKVIAAAQKLARINSQITIEPIIADVSHENIEALVAGVTCIVDGTDNFETRFLLNEAALRWQIPWVYGGCLGASGQVLTILPGETPCLRCLIREVPPPGSMPTCDSAGILAPSVGMVASLQCQEVLKICSGQRQAINRSLVAFDLWDNRLRPLSVAALQAQRDCPACGTTPEYPFLEGKAGRQPTVLCGRNAVQLSAVSGSQHALDSLELKLAPLGRVQRNAFLLRFEAEGYLLTLFPDGRAIVQGTEEAAVARSVLARFIGS